MLTKFSHSGCRALHRRDFESQRENISSAFSNTASYIVASLLVMHITYTLWEQIWCQDRCFLVPEHGFRGRDRIRKEQLPIMRRVAFFFLMFLLTFRFSDFFFFCFSRRLFFPPGSFVNYYFNVGCFHNLHFSILCSYSSCLCRALKYLITNKSAAVSFLLEKQQSSWEGLLRAVLY